jgi:hypothetical protein
MKTKTAATREKSNTLVATPRASAEVMTILLQLPRDEGLYVEMGIDEATYDGAAVVSF